MKTLLLLLAIILTGGIALAKRTLIGPCEPYRDGGCRTCSDCSHCVNCHRNHGECSVCAPK